MSILKHPKLCNLNISTNYIGIIIILMFFSSISLAKADYFVGGGVGYQNDRLDGESSLNGEDSFFQLNAGLTIESKHRVTGTYSYKDKFSQSLFFASYDYLYYLSDKIALSGGFLLGVGYNDIVDESSLEFLRGLQVGSSFKINNDWSTDILYRYMHQDFEEEGVDIDNSQQIVIIANYHF
ncbi:porin family protein [Photobacterium minamisatsumaniensis]|uniref:porin family protein n=1 Tax=Photobacterium minamisatsumaniensis TaxID=2910233 RepID=UPI003D0FB587